MVSNRLSSDRQPEIGVLIVDLVGANLKAFTFFIFDGRWLFLNLSCLSKFHFVSSYIDSIFVMDRKTMKRKGQVPLSNVPKQLKVADRGYEVFTQEAKRSSTPGGSRKHLARIREEEEKKAEGNQGLFINCYFYCSILMFVSD